MFMPPMLLKTAREPFDSKIDLFEPKIDGHRMIFSCIDEQIRLYTRHNNEVTNKYPELLTGINEDIILDGEVSQADPETENISLEAINERFQLQRSEKILAQSKANPCSFIVWDILRFRGQDLRHLPLLRRKEILAGIEFNNPNISRIPFVENEGIKLFRTIQERGWEGVVAKSKNSGYSKTGRRVSTWRKIINWRTLDNVLIVGYRRSELGWLAAVQEGHTLRHVGIIEYGIKPAHKKAFYALSKKIETGCSKDYVYLEPVFRAKIKTRNFTKYGMLRDAVFIDFVI